MLKTCIFFSETKNTTPQKKTHARDGTQGALHELQVRVQHVAPGAAGLHAAAGPLDLGRGAGAPVRLRGRPADLLGVRDAQKVVPAPARRTETVKITRGLYCFFIASVVGWLVDSDWLVISDQGFVVEKGGGRGAKSILIFRRFSLQRGKT